MQQRRTELANRQCAYASRQASVPCQKNKAIETSSRLSRQSLLKLELCFRQQLLFFGTMRLEMHHKGYYIPCIVSSLDCIHFCTIFFKIVVWLTASTICILWSGRNSIRLNKHSFMLKISEPNPRMIRFQYSINNSAEHKIV